MHLHSNALVLHLAAGTRHEIFLIGDDMHSYILFQSSCDIAISNALTEAIIYFYALSFETNSSRPWKEVIDIVNKVHNHICGHPTYTDVKILLQRSYLWSDEIEQYLTTVIDECHSCRATAPPKSALMVSFSSLNRSFNGVVCLEHFYLDALCQFHVMDSSGRLAAATVVTDTSLSVPIAAVEATWMTVFGRRELFTKMMLLTKGYLYCMLET